MIDFNESSAAQSWIEYRQIIIDKFKKIDKMEEDIHTLKTNIELLKRDAKLFISIIATVISAAISIAMKFIG